MKSNYSSGSALLLAIMVISVLTTTTLGAIAIRFDQLLATDRITSASKAKLAADSGLVKLREKLAANQTSFSPEAFDLTNQEGLTIPAQGRFRPNPRHSAYSLESQVINLPRCLAVAVLSPWVNTGNYLLGNDDSANNAALLFYYANIINETTLGTIGNITGNSSGYSAVEKERSMSELTKMGQFYNPYASSRYGEFNSKYWTINLGGPKDEFLYKKDPNGTGSFYRGLDFLYIPYLPRFTDSGVLKVANEPASGLVRKDASTIRNDFENVIKDNNLKVWLDGSVTNDLLYQYGLGDLFTETGEEQSRITWLQPSLWNDLPEADTESGYANGLSGPYSNSNITTATSSPMQWQRQSTPTKSLASPDSGWNTEIVRGGKSFSFVYPSGDLNREITPGTTISFNLFGSLEGLRLNQLITVTALDKNYYRPFPLRSRDNTSMGKFYGVKITKLTKLGNGEIAVELTFANNAYQTPFGASNISVKLNDIAVISLQAGPQMSTKRSLSNVTLQTDGRLVTTAPSSCNYSESTYVVCPAVGDVVNLSKSGAEPAWGQVTNVTFTSSGSQLTSFELDKFREMPLPIRDLASTLVSDGGIEKIAYYGGAITSTEFDGGVNSISDGLWLFNPAEVNQNNAWTYLPNTPAGGDLNNLPGPRAGASLATVDNSIYLFGGYHYTGAGELTSGGAYPCADNYYLVNCLGTNLPGTRLAKTFPNTMFRFDLTTKQWSKVTYDVVNTNQPSIVNGTWLELKTVSKFGDRTGKDNWPTKLNVNTNNGTSPVDLELDPTAQTTLNLTTSNVGMAVGDEIYLNGTKSVDDTPVLVWSRITALPTATSIRIKTYGVKNGTGTVSVKALSITSLARTKGSAKCIWQDALQTQTTPNSCLIDARIDGIGVGDAVVLEQPNVYTDPTQLVNSFSGYVSSINGNVVSFVESDVFAGFDDFKSGTTPFGQSVRNLPIGRASGKLSSNGTKLYYWQGDQSENNNARIVDVWEFDTATNRWTNLPLTLGTLPAGNLTLQTVRMPSAATVFTSTSSANNQELRKDKLFTWDNFSQQTTEYIWDNDKTWNIEITDESGNSFWNTERVTEDATIIVERHNNAIRERFTGIVTAINTSEPNKITVRHHPDYPGDSGLTNHSANAKVGVNYSNTSNAAAISVSNAVKNGVDMIQVDDSSAAAQLRKIPAGAVVMAYSGSLTGTNTNIVTATVDSRGLPSANRVTFTAAGAAFVTTPLQQAQSNNTLVGSGVEDQLALSYQNYRPKGTEGAMEWVNNLTGVTNAKKWVGRFPAHYVFTNSVRPAARSNGIIAATPDKHTAIIAGGTSGPYTNIWQLQGAHQFAGSIWGLGKSNASAASDLPNLYGASGEITSSGEMIVFGGQRKFTTTNIGPKITVQSTDNPSSYGVFTMVDDGASDTVKSAQFVNQLHSQYTGVARPSLKYASDEGDIKDYCQYIGQENCDGQLIGQLGTLGGFGSWGPALAVINPGDGFKTESGTRSLILSGPTQTLTNTSSRLEQEGYTPYRCDINAAGCLNFPFGSLSYPETNNSKTLMLAGYSRISGGGSILVTPAGVGRAITTGRTGNSYCSRDTTNEDYSCKISQYYGGYMKWIPDSEDVLFMFNAAKALSSTDAYRIVGYYGGVVRGYLAVSAGSDLNVQEIAP